MKDNRISNLLQITNLQDRSFNLSDDYLTAPLHIDYTNALNHLDTERQESLDWLKINLNN